jgi:hypothetical protein
MSCKIEQMTGAIDKEYIWNMLPVPDKCPAIFGIASVDDGHWALYCTLNSSPTTEMNSV